MSSKLQNRNNPGGIVVKKSIFNLKERLTFGALTILFLYFLTQYTIWWFQATHVANNWQGPILHILDFIIFGLLSFIVFIGSTQRLGSLFALWFASEPVYLSPPKGLKVAFLTCFVPGKEPIDMLIKTLNAMNKVRYPHDSWVLDEGGSDEVKDICKKLGIRYFSRKNIKKYNQDKGKFREKTKAGNHNAWRDQHEKDYDIVAQIDMDHVPEPNYFEKTLGYFKDPKVGFVGMPQFYKNTNNWIARGAAEQAYFFNGPMQQGFYGSDMPFLIGTSHIYRASAMNKIGGYAPTIVEDHLTGMKFYEHGYKAVFVPEILAKGEGPLNWVDYFNQQMRWSYGLFEILFKHTPKIIWKLKLRQKINYFLAQLYYFTGVAVVLGMILTFIYLVFGIRSANMDLLNWVVFATPVFLISNAIQLYCHKFSINPKKEPVFGILGMFLNLGANLIYALAFIKFITGQKLKYMVTQKGATGEAQKVPLQAFKFHLFGASLMFYALVNSFLAGNSAVQLRFWAVFNILTLSAVAFSVYSHNLSSIVSFFRLDLRPVRLALTSVFVLMLLTGSILSFPYFKVAVNAYLDSKPIQELGAPIAGKLLPPDAGTYLGVSLYQHNDTDYLNALEDQTGKEFAIVGYYQSWGVMERSFNKNWATNIHNNGSIPLITWEPWEPISGFDRSELIVDQANYRLKNIIDGKYDDYIWEYAKDIKSYKKPVMIRFAHEMNGNWYPWGSTFNTPQEYILAWRHVHEIFDSVGATNVTWVWSPNEVYFEEKVPNAARIELFYPGDDYVDWVGFSAFNWAGSYKHNVWRSPKDLYERTLAKLKKFGKPIMITETASAESKVDKAAKGKWIEQFANYIKENPEIKGVIWFNTEDNGVNWTLGSSESSINAFKSSFDNYFHQEI